MKGIEGQSSGGGNKTLRFYMDTNDEGKEVVKFSVI